VRRREFITLAGGMLAVWPLVAIAQQAGKSPTIGFFGSSTAISQGAWAAEQFSPDPCAHSGIRRLRS
jgi:hypothetical protein